MITALAAVALAGAASAALAGAPAHTDPLAVSVSPAIVAVQVGQHNFTSTITVTDVGTQPVMVSPGLRLLVQGPTGPVSDPAPAWASLRSVSGLPLASSIRLAPGDSLSVKLVLAAPASVKSTQDVVTQFTASPASAAQVRVGAVVDSRTVLRLGGSAVIPHYTTTPNHLAAAAPKSSSSPAAAYVALGVLLFLLAALVLAIRWVIRRHRHSIAS